MHTTKPHENVSIACGLPLIAQQLWLDQETADIGILRAAFGQEPQQVSTIFFYQWRFTIHTAFTQIPEHYWTPKNIFVAPLYWLFQQRGVHH